MVTPVQVRQYQARDGSRHATRRAAELHENFIDPPEVDAQGIAFAGPSSDLHTNLWRWTCGFCKASGPTVNTMFRRYSQACPHCHAVNLFDFSKHGA